MYKHWIGARAHKALGAPIWIAASLTTLGWGPAAGQTPPSPAASDAAPSESLRRQALGPYRFILQNSNVPAKPRPAPAPQAAEPRRAAAPTPAAAVEQAAVAPQPTPAIAPPEPVAEPAPAPVPVAVAAPRAPEPPIAKVLKALIPIKQDPPQLTAALARERAVGTVKVGFEVNPNGSTGGVKVLSSSNRRLNNVAMEAVADWRFQPIDDTRLTEIELVFSDQ